MCISLQEKYTLTHSAFLLVLTTGWLPKSSLIPIPLQELIDVVHHDVRARVHTCHLQFGVPTGDNCADVLTKPLPLPLCEEHRRCRGVYPHWTEGKCEELSIACRCGLRALVISRCELR
jgi:hypothetical protein